MRKFFDLILSRFTFSGDIIDGYWMKFTVIKAETDLGDHLFHQKAEIER